MKRLYFFLQFLRHADPRTPDEYRSSTWPRSDLLKASALP